MAGQFIARLLGLPAYRDKTTALVLTAQQTIYRAIIVLLTVTAILWMAVFLYVAFYYSYMPAISHTRPVHLQFESCGREPGLCSYPTANVTLTRRQQLLMVGQPYRILVELDMPESRKNQELGMFMVCLELKDSEKVVMDKSCRAAMLHYKSPLLHSIMTTMLAPVFISGSAEEKQMVGVELFSGFEEDPSRPVTEAKVQIQSQHVEVYKVALRIHAHFTGLRYFMFHWPVLSAFLGIMTNLFFLSVIAFLSWYKYFTPKQVVVHVGYDSNAAKSLEERRAMAKERLMRERSKLVQQKSTDPKDGNGENNTEEKEVKDDKPDNQKSSKPNTPRKESKEDLEVPPVAPNDEEDKSTSSLASTKEEKSEEADDRRTSEEYEVISPAGEKVKGDATDEDEEAFLELDTAAAETDTKKSSGEDDKENIPHSSKKKKVKTEDDNKGESNPSEVRQRKAMAKGPSTSGSFDDGQSSC